MGLALLDLLCLFGFWTAEGWETIGVSEAHGEIVGVTKAVEIVVVVENVTEVTGDILVGVEVATVAGIKGKASVVSLAQLVSSSVALPAQLVVFLFLG